MNRLFSYLISTLFILAWSCTAEISFITPAEEISEPVTITAYIDNSDDVKTAYADETTFTWKAGDRIAVQLYGIKEGDTYYHTYDQWKFTANSTSSSSTFTQSEALNTNIWEIHDYAFYPKESAYGTDTELLYTPGDKGANSLWLYHEITPSVSDPMGTIPLIGRKQTGADVTTNAEFRFKTAVGIVKINVTNIPASARKIILTARGGEKLTGYFSFDDDCEIKIANHISNGRDNKTIHFTPDYEGETRSFYFPIPTGTLASGIQVKLLDGDDNELKKIGTDKSITITRNQLLILPSINGGSDWSYLGTGKYVDNFLFSKLLDSDDKSLVKTGIMVDVPIWKSASVEGKYKMTSPYKLATTQFSCKTLETKSVDDEFVFYTSYAGLTPGEVYFESNTTGVCFDANTHQAKICSPQDNSSDQTSNNKVLYSKAGAPTVIQLAPRYEDASNSSYCYTKYSSPGMVYIVFPDENPGKTVIGKYYVGGTPSSKYSYDIEESEDLSKGNVKLTGYSNTKDDVSFSGVAYGTYNPATGTLSFATKQLFCTGLIDANTVYYSIYADDLTYLLNTATFNFSGTYNWASTGQSFIQCSRTGVFGLMYYTDEANLGTWTGYNLTGQKFTSPTLVRYDD